MYTDTVSNQRKLFEGKLLYYFITSSSVTKTNLDLEWAPKSCGGGGEVVNLLRQSERIHGNLTPSRQQ